MKKLCFVVGQHRSGTSALTGLLNAFGAKLGEGHVHEQDQWNVKGYFENKNFESFNEEILCNLGTFWSDVAPVKFSYDEESPMWSGAKIALVDLLRKTLASVEDGSLLVIKDPRISLLIGLYCAALKELTWEVDVSFIFSQRDRQENIDSIVRRGALGRWGPNGEGVMTHAWAEAILARHEAVFEANFDYRHPMVYHTYSNLFYKLEPYMRHLDNLLNLGLDFSEKAIAEASTFLEHELRHERHPRSCKVIATYFGGRRRWPSGFEETRDMWSQILKLEKKNSPGDAMDTIVVLHEHGDQRAIDFVNSLDALPTRFGLMKALVRPWEDGVGASFKSFNHAFSTFREEYENWIFDEDNVLFVDHGYLLSAKRQMLGRNDVAFLGMMRCDAREVIMEDGKVTGGRLFTPQERAMFPSIWHCHGGCGFTTRKHLDEVVARFGSLPYAGMVKPGFPGDGLFEDHAWYRASERDGEVRFTTVYHQLGYKVLEIDHPRPITFYKYDNSYA